MSHLNAKDSPWRGAGEVSRLFEQGVRLVEVALEEGDLGGEAGELLSRGGGLVSRDGEELEVCVLGEEGADGGAALSACGAGDEEGARHWCEMGGQGS